jgi:hypothetical protein
LYQTELPPPTFPGEVIGIIISPGGVKIVLTSFFKCVKDSPKTFLSRPKIPLKEVMRSKKSLCYQEVRSSEWFGFLPAAVPGEREKVLKI